jgi:hypothetical protein
MRKHKKVIFIALAAVLVLGATLGAVAMAQADDEGTKTVKETLYERVAQVYQTNTGNTIDAAELQKAFAEAQKQLSTEARDQMWQKLVDEGKITQEQLDALKAWLEARPQMTTDEFKQWLESKPEDLPFGFEKRAPAMPRGFDRMGKMFRGWCAPDNAE